MITLGLNAAFHDSSAALAVDGVVVAAATGRSPERMPTALGGARRSAGQPPEAL